jgi:hypothetical protein
MAAEKKGSRSCLIRRDAIGWRRRKVKSGISPRTP